MTVYGKRNMVKKEHVKIIEKQLIDLGSKMHKTIGSDKGHFLSNILYLACGGGTYSLEIEKIASIGNNEFSIDRNGVMELCRESLTRSEIPNKC